MSGRAGEREREGAAVVRLRVAREQRDARFNPGANRPRCLPAHGPLRIRPDVDPLPKRAVVAFADQLLLIFVSLDLRDEIVDVRLASELGGGVGWVGGRGRSVGGAIEQVGGLVAGGKLGGAVE